MDKSQIIFWCLKFVFGGLSAFFAILLWSKSREFCYVSLIISVLLSYCGIIYEMMSALGVIDFDNVQVAGLPVFRLFFLIVPTIFMIIALVLMIKKLIRRS